ncbi:UDP-glycosyltransferase 88F5-like [Triticum aestivum]|uniref:UDP-glycosyltransferase 88F5-like n=1 Tax=Triticum aestivum TaxID=4565 RepID=UPI001D006D16|nr:UDP-glycosyltransferase 88F5-like [Triticum aestivum]
MATLPHNFTPRRSTRIAKADRGLDSESKAKRVLLLCLGLTKDDEPLSDEVMVKYNKLFEHPLAVDVVRVFAEFYGWQESKLALVSSVLVCETLGPAFDKFFWLPAEGTRGGIILAWNSDRVALSNPSIGDHHVSATALDVGAELGVPTYFFFTTCIGSVAFGLYHPVIDERTTLGFGDMGGDPVHAPGLPPIPADHLAGAIQDRESLSNRHFVDLGLRMCDSMGVLVNGCRSLEPAAADAIVAGLCNPQCRPTPPLYCVGPLMKHGEETGASKRHECLAWLDGQPDASVVFLCFGSMGRFSAEQVKEIAAGLETSGQRFLWVVRRPPPPGAERRPPADGDDDGDIDELFPEGFLQRTKDRGLVVMSLTSWAPQRQVLAHGAVGGFVTHCGWNSVLEAIMAGVPMLAWPLYAEQRMNRVFLVEEMRLAVPMEGYDKKMVESDEVAAKVRWLIESDGGREFRQRTRAAMRLAEEAVGDSGESRAALVDLARQWKSAAHS